jgi:Fe2+ or Zn2+ uptake regulation protein
VEVDDGSASAAPPQPAATTAAPATQKRTILESTPRERTRHMRTGIIYSMASWADHALSGLSAAGLRRGGARRTVVEFLDDQRCCLSAQEIHDGIRAAGGTVGVASVYRALETLAELRLVQRVDRRRRGALRAAGGTATTITTSPYDCGRVERSRTTA